MMNKEQMLQIAERNLKKAKKALDNNCNRQGITELEIENLNNSIEYANTVYDLIVKYVN